MKQSYFHRVTAQTPTRFWINNVTPEEARLAIDAGAESCTQNPSYTRKMLASKTAGPHAYALLDGILVGGADNEEAQALLQLELVKEIAAIFLPLYERSHGRYGYVTIQGNPFMEDRDSILRFARMHCDAAPNIMAKIPAIPAGFDAMRVLLREKRPVLATEVMSVRQASDCMDVYDEILEETGEAPVLWFAHIPGIFDEYLAGAVAKGGIDIPGDYMWQAGVAVAKKIAALRASRASGIGFCSGGARGQHHFTEMVGAPSGVTINWAGSAEDLLRLDPPVVQSFLRPTPEAVLDMLCERVPDFRRAYELAAITPGEYERFGPVCLFRDNFESAWTAAREMIAARR